MLIRLLRSKGYGQPIRVDGPQSHQTKRGTPTMGGSVFVVASLIGYLVGHAVTGEPLTTSGVLVLLLTAGLMIFNGGGYGRSRAPAAAPAPVTPAVTRPGLR